MSGGPFCDGFIKACNAVNQVPRLHPPVFCLNYYEVVKFAPSKGRYQVKERLTAHTGLEVALRKASVSRDSSAALSWWSHAWLGTHVQVASSLKLRCCWAHAWAENTALFCTLTASCNPQSSSCSQKTNGTSWVPSQQCCRWHKSHLLTRASWALILCHSVPRWAPHNRKQSDLKDPLCELRQCHLIGIPQPWTRIWSTLWLPKATVSCQSQYGPLGDDATPS